MTYTPSKKKKKSILFKIITIGSVAIIVVILTVLVSDTILVSNYKNKVNNYINYLLSDKERHTDPSGRAFESESFEEMQSKLPFHAAKPKWIPEGFELQFADFEVPEGDTYFIKYLFINESIESDFKYLEIGIAVNFPIALSRETYSVKTELIKVNDLDVIVAYVYEDDIKYYHAIYYNEQGYIIDIGNTSSKETLVKIIENME